MLPPSKYACDPLQLDAYLLASDAQVVAPSEADLQTAYRFGGYQVSSCLAAGRGRERSSKCGSPAPPCLLPLTGS